MASRYPVRPRLEQNRACIPTSVILNSNRYQIVTRKKKVLEELAEASLNMDAAKSKSEKQNRPSLAARFTEKESGQQIIQFSSPVTKFTEASAMIPEQAFELVLEVVGDSADTSMEAAPFSSL